MGDAFGAGIINYLSRNDIQEFNNQINKLSNQSLIDAVNTSSNNNSSISLRRFGLLNTSKNNNSNTGQKNNSNFSLITKKWNYGCNSLNLVVDYVCFFGLLVVCSTWQRFLRMRCLKTIGNSERSFEWLRLVQRCTKPLRLIKCRSCCLWKHNFNKMPECVH